MAYIEAMNPFLKKSKKRKYTEYGTNDMVWWGTCSMQGWRKQMEDTHISEEINLPGGGKAMLFGVFDGHGGKEISIIAKAKYADAFVDTMEF